MKFASANFHLNISLKAKYITHALREFHLRSKFNSREARISLRPKGAFSLPQRGRGTTEVVDEEIGVCTA